MSFIGDSEARPEVTAFVNDYLTYSLSRGGYQWSCPPPPDVIENRIPLKAVQALRTLTDEFCSQYKDHFVEMCARIEVTEVSLTSTFVGISNELFSEGIKWARIVALFVFASELALNSKDRNLPHLIGIIAQTLSSYISEKLLPWINDHGGWEGLIVFNEGPDSEQLRNGKWPSVKNLLCIGISALGALSLGALLSKS